MKEVTRAVIEQRIRDLTAQRDALVNNVNAFNGAIEDCEFWLRFVEEAEEKEKDETSARPA